MPLVNMLKKTPSMIAKITPAQISSVKNGWWMGQLVKTVGNSLNKAQIQSIPLSGVNVAGALSAQQISWLKPAQLGAVKGGMPLVNMLKKTPSVIAEISPAQVGSITNGWWFGHIPKPALQAMSKAQVNAIPNKIYPNIKGRLTSAQQAWRP